MIPAAEGKPGGRAPGGWSETVRVNSANIFPSGHTLNPLPRLAQVLTVWLAKSDKPLCL